MTDLSLTRLERSSAPFMFLEMLLGRFGIE